MMAPHPNDSPLPYFTYGAVDESEQRTSDSSLLPKASSCSRTRCGWCRERDPPHQKNLRKPEARRRSISLGLAATVLCAMAFLTACGVWWNRSTDSRNTAAAAGRLFEIGSDAGIAAAEIRPNGIPAGSAAAVAALEFTALNFYHVRDGKPGQDYPWLKDVKLIEPHRDTTLSVVGPREGFGYRWEVRAGGSSSSGGVGEVQATATGAVTIVVLTQLDENVVVLEEVDGDGRVTNRLEETVLVKYVRREIRSLTNDEKEELLDAVSAQ